MSRVTRRSISNYDINVNYFNPETIIKFHRIIGPAFKGFRTITPERKVILDSILNSICTRGTDGKFLSKMQYAAEKLISGGIECGEIEYKSLSKEDILYLFIKIVDPDFKYVELMELAKDSGLEFNEYVTRYHGYCYKELLMYERIFINKFCNIHELEESFTIKK